MPDRVDVAVVGGGYTGVAAARALARAGGDVAVLERHSLGWGASTRNAGFVLPGYQAEIADLIARTGLPGARSLFQFSLDSVRFVERLVEEERIACDYQRCGHLILAARPSHLERLRADQRLMQDAFGYETGLLGPTDLRAEIGSNRYHGALLDPGGGGIHPARYFFGLAAAAARAGARLIGGVDVVRLNRGSGGYKVVTSCGTVRAKEVLIATNGYTGGLVPALQRRVVPVGSYMIATAPLPEALALRLVPRGRVLSDTKNLLFYFRLSPDRRLVFGGRASFTPTTVARSAAILRRGMLWVFPELENVPVEYAWGGNVGFTLDHLPHAGKENGVHYALGYCGHGVAMAGYLGHRMGEAMAEREPLPLLAELTFPPVPLYGGWPWFLPLAGAYYRLKDWIG